MTGLGVSCGFSTELPETVVFSHALDMPEKKILDVHNCAIEVNSPSLQQNADQMLLFEGTPIARPYQIEEDNFLVLSFLNLSEEDYRRMEKKTLSVAESLREKVTNINKDIILTGYGYGANLAAWVAYTLSTRPGLFRSSQLKLIIFCAEENVTAPFHNVLKKNLLHFSRFFGRPIPQKSPCIEMPISLISDLRTRFIPSRLIILPFLIAMNCFVTKKLRLKSLWRYAGYAFSTLFSLYYSLKDKPLYLDPSAIRRAFDYTVDAARFAHDFQYPFYIRDPIHE